MKVDEEGLSDLSRRDIDADPGDESFYRVFETKLESDVGVNRRIPRRGRQRRRGRGDTASNERKPTRVLLDHDR